MRRIIPIALTIVLGALLGPMPSAAQTAVEAIPNARPPSGQIGAPGIERLVPGGETRGGNQNQNQEIAVPEAEMGDSETEAPDSGEAAQSQSDQSDSSDAGQNEPAQTDQ